MTPGGFVTAPAVRVGAFYGLLFTGIGVMLPFWPAWLETRGLGAVEIGFIMAAAQWSKVLVNPVVSSHVDRTGRRRTTMVVMALAALVGFTVLLPLSGFWPLFLVAVPATACMACLMPLAESVAMGVVRRTGADYGRMRLWGSITFMLAAVVAGAALEALPVEVVVPAAILGSLALTAASAATLPDDAPRTVGTAPLRLDGSGLLRLLRNPPFLLFLACVGLSQASHAPYYGFSTLHWRAAGLSDAFIGALWALGVIVEVALFAFGNRVLAALGPMGLLMAAAVGGIVRWTVLAGTTHPAALVGVQGLHALTYAAGHLGAMHFIARAVPHSHAVRAQGLYSALAMGALLGLSMIAAGSLYESTGGLAFLLGTGLCAGAAVFGLLLARRWDGGALWVEDETPATGAAVSPPSPGTPPRSAS
ncbi:MFS transporter [Roseospira navarrensis]|uniref:MFS transporter n=1 Tax=Roseospira navarrensis TaxID=140058 RepID=A0A7X2D333_9PROT|nr:MFS transporter [Roseospira navarrensis]MQX36894.1 MFS transporter [Roseospira navarrensis]